MKYLLTIALLYPLLSLSQPFATIEGHVISTKGDYQPGWGATFSAGGFLKSKGVRSFMVGAGITIDQFYPGEFYSAPFFQMGYFNPKAKITPYVNARLGYGLYKQSGHFADVHSNRGGLFTDIRAGAGFKVTKFMRITPFVSVQGLALRYVTGGQTTESYFVALPNAGAALVFTK